MTLIVIIPLLIHCVTSSRQFYKHFHILSLGNPENYISMKIIISCNLFSLHRPYEKANMFMQVLDRVEFFFVPSFYHCC